MATKNCNIALETAHFNNFFSYLTFDALCPKTVYYLLEQGLIQVSSAYEAALAKVKGCHVVSKDTNDLSDGSDAKLSSVRTSGYRKIYSAPITNTSGKTGPLRVQVYERINNKFYYFVIPYSAYKEVPKKVISKSLLILMVHQGVFLAE